MIHTENEKKEIAESLLKDIGIDKLANVGIANTGDVAPTRKTSEYLKSSIGWVFGCINSIGDEIANIDICLYKKSGTVVKEIESHPAIDLLYQVNEFTTKFDFFSLIGQYLELTGEAPIYISFERGRPAKMLLLKPDRFYVKPGTNGNIINGYEYEVEAGQRIQLEVKEVLFLKYTDPNRTTRGLGTLQAVARTVDIDDFSEEYNKKFYFNSARPDSVLSTDQKLNDKQLLSITKKFEQKYKGLDNAHKTIILQGGLKHTALNLTQKDMDFMEQQKFSRDKILAIFRVPKSILGITEDVNRANAEASEYIFAKRTIKPKMERIVQQLNEFYLPLFPGTENMFFDFVSPVPEDEVNKRANVTAGLTSGFMTINEARERQGLPDVGEKGDVLRLPIGYTDLEVYDEQGAPVTGLSFSRDRLRLSSIKSARMNRIHEVKASLIEMVAKRIYDGVLIKKGDGVIDLKKIEKKELTDEEKSYFAFQKRQLGVADEYSVKFENKFQDIFKIQEEEIIGRLNKKDLSPKDFLLTPSKQRKLYVRELSELFVGMIVDQSKQAYDFLDIEDETKPTDPMITDYLSNRAFKFSSSVTATTNRSLKNTLTEGILAGEGIPQLTARVSEVFTDASKTRAETIARSETIRATNYATLETYKESGVVKGKRWLATEDDRTCEFCDKMDGTVLGLDNDYVGKGDTFVGREGGLLVADYESIEHPPLHPSCRCTLIPIVDKSMKKLDEKKKEIDDETLEAIDSLIKTISKDEQTD